MRRIGMQGVSFAYDRRQMTLKDITLDIFEGDSVGIIGANGAGKSTLLKLLVGLLTPYQGSIIVDELPVKKENYAAIRKKLGFVFQDAENQLFMNTVYEDVAFAPRNYNVPEEEVRKQTQEALRITGIEHLRDRAIYKLSGGEKKLASIATILSVKPEILLLDEPTIALDPRNRRNLIKIMNSLPQTRIIASHDLDFILDTCAVTMLMKEGTIVGAGRTQEILTNQQLLEENGLELPLRFYK